MTLYTATGLADITYQFDARAEVSGETAERMCNVRDAMMHRQRASVWHEVSDILRNTTLTPDPIIAELVTALQASQAALNDWIHTYAGEMCDEDDVKRSIARIGLRGTLAYIASVQSQNMAVLAKIEGAA